MRERLVLELTEQMMDSDVGLSWPTVVDWLTHCASRPTKTNFSAAHPAHSAGGALPPHSAGGARNVAPSAMSGIAPAEEAESRTMMMLNSGHTETDGHGLNGRWSGLQESNNKQPAYSSQQAAWFRANNAISHSDIQAPASSHAHAQMSSSSHTDMIMPTDASRSVSSLAHQRASSPPPAHQRASSLVHQQTPIDHRADAKGSVVKGSVVKGSVVKGSVVKGMGQALNGYRSTATINTRVDHYVIALERVSDLLEGDWRMYCKPQGEEPYSYGFSVKNVTADPEDSCSLRWEGEGPGGLQCFQPTAKFDPETFHVTLYYQERWTDSVGQLPRYQVDMMSHALC